MFCAGNDLGDFLQASQGGGLAPPAALPACAGPQRDSGRRRGVAGPAVGVGTTMLLHCDHVVAADNAVLSTPFAAFGLVPEAASTLLAPRLMGHARAFSLLVMGEPLDAAAAMAAGIVNAVVPVPKLDGTARSAAQKIAALPPGGVGAARRLMRGPPKEIVAHIDAEAAEFRQRLAAPEAQAAFRAFLERKK